MVESLDYLTLLFLEEGNPLGNMEALPYKIHCLTVELPWVPPTQRYPPSPHFWRCPAKAAVLSFQTPKRLEQTVFGVKRCAAATNKRLLKGGASTLSRRAAMLGPLRVGEEVELVPDLCDDSLFLSSLIVLETLVATSVFLKTTVNLYLTHMNL